MNEDHITGAADEQEARADRISALSRQVATLEARERDTAEVVIAHRDRIAALEAEREALRAALADPGAEAGGLSDRETAELVIAHRDRITAIQAQRDELLEARSDSKARLEKLEAQLADGAESLRQAAEQRAEESRKAEKQRSEEVRKEKERRSEELRKAKEERRKAEVQLGKDRERIAALESERKELLAFRTKSEARLEKLEGRLEERAEELRKADAERAEALRKADTGRVAELRRADAKRAEELRKADAARAQALRKADAARAEDRRKAELRLHKERERTAALKAGQKELLAFRKKSEARLERLEAQLAERAEKLRGADAVRAEELLALRTELEAELEKLKGQLEERADQLRGAEADRAEERRKAKLSEESYRKLLARVESLQSSPSYRLLRVVWRLNAAVKRLVPGSSKRRGAGELEEGAAPAAGQATLEAGAEPAAESEQAAAGPAASPARPSAERASASAGPEPTDPARLRVAAIMDEMSQACFGPECELLPVGEEDWGDLESQQPHLLLVESAWRGNGSSWRYKVGSYDRADLRGIPRLRALVDWCRAREIPTVFWAKEDPIHFDRFKEAASLFDCVFTTDENCVSRYSELEREGNGPVKVLQFAAQPRIHNPIALPGQRSPAPCFAGTYYRNRHVDRRRSLEMLLDAARPLGLVIYDRTFDWDNESFGFPDRFLPHVQGAIPYGEIVDVYKSHKVFLNVNSVVDSPTMFSRRVLELSACDTAVVSTESEGIEHTFGDLVSVVKTPSEATEVLTRLLEDDAHRRDLARRARRLVLGRHTYRQRLIEIGRTIGYPLDADGADGVSALSLVDDPGDERRIDSLLAAIAGQRSLPAEVLIGVKAAKKKAKIPRELPGPGGKVPVKVVPQDADLSRADRYRELAALSDLPWTGIFDVAHEYGEHHLEDLVAGTRFADAEVLGSAAFGIAGRSEVGDAIRENRFVDGVHPHSALARTALVERRGWPDEMPASGETMRDWFREGVRFYSGDASNFRADPALGLPQRAGRASSASTPVR